MGVDDPEHDEPTPPLTPAVDPRDLPHWPLTADQVPPLLPKVIS